MLKKKLLQQTSIRLNNTINKNTIASFKILQMSIRELYEFSKNEIEKNPLLSIKLFKRDNFNSELIDNLSENINIKLWLYQQSYFLFDGNYKNLVKIYIENLDDNGFCKISSDEAATITSETNDNANMVLQKLKKLDPVGIFSESLEDNLRQQLIKLKIHNDTYEIFLKNLNLVATFNYKKLMKIGCISKNEVKKIINDIKKLKPRPIDALVKENINLSVPDIIVKKDKNNKKLTVLLNNDNTFKININKEYEKKIKKENSNLEIKEYFKNCKNHANWLTNCIKRRNKTLIKVSSEIARYQKNFFFKETKEILPLNLKQISKICNYHETTIGRAIKNKNIYFDNQIFPVKNFFSSKLKNYSNNSAVSSVSIKTKIKTILSIEKDSMLTYSDQQLVEIFKKEGIQISRRTITKYRQDLNIPSSIVRKRLK